MSMTIRIKDETASGKSLREFMLEFLTEKVTVAELIRARVFQEVKDYNAKKPELYQGLVQPTDAEATLNGFKLDKKQEVDWQEQFARAKEAFEGNRVLVLVDGKQADSLEQEITLSPSTEVSFLKLVPLVGG